MLCTCLEAEGWGGSSLTHLFTGRTLRWPAGLDLTLSVTVSRQQNPNEPQHIGASNAESAQSKDVRMII